MDKKYLAYIFCAALVGAFVGAFLTGYIKKSLGATELTINPSNSSYTDSADLKQNVQAIAEKMAGLNQYEFLQADSQGRMQAVDSLTQLVQSGSVASYTASGTLTAAEICNDNLVLETAAGTTSTLTLPATSTLFADCLDDNYDSRSLVLLNGSATTGTIYAAGTGGELLYSSSLTVAAGKAAILTIIRTSATAYKALLLNLSN